MAEGKRILVLFAHPSIERSEVNKPLARATQRFSNVTFVDLYADYPTLEIDVDLEQERLRDHDVIVFMFPMYWYSTPAILKEWQDLVLEYGFAYGAEGRALRGKLFFCAVSTGGPEAAYHAEGYAHAPVRALLAPIEQMAALCGMRYLPPFLIHGARRAAEEGRVGAHVADWRELVTSIQDDRVDLAAVANEPNLNGALESGLKEQI